MSKEIMSSKKVFEREQLKTLNKTIRPKGVKVSLDNILKWEPGSTQAHEIYKSSVPLVERKKGFKINPLANEKAKIQSLASTGSHSDLFSAVGGTETMDVYTFNYWQYTDSFVFWDGLVPTPDIIDSGHRNGVPVYGTLFFNWSTSENDQAKVRYVLQKDSRGNYPVALKLIEIADYYGFDGYFINQETDMPDGEGYGEAFRSFLLYFKQQAAQRDKSLAIAWYDAMDNGGSRYHYDAVNSQNDLFIEVSEESNTVPADDFFMNFNWTAEKVKTTAEHLNVIGRSPFDAYAGWELQAGGYYHTAQNKRALLDEKGQLQLSLGLFIPDSVMGIAEDGEDYHIKADKFWTGFGGNPAKEADEFEWSGMSRFVTDYTPLVNTEFYTSFNTGHGKGYFVKGKQVSSTPWNSRGIQDILPTWRWWTDNKNAAISVRYDFDEVYNAGTSIAFEGDMGANGCSSTMLYSTEIPLKKDSQLALTLKGNQNVKVQIGLSTNPTYREQSFYYYTLENSVDWSENNIHLEELSGQTVYAIKLRLVSENGVSDYKLNLGELAIHQREEALSSPETCEVLERVLFNAQEAEAILKISPVKSAKQYEVYQKTGDNWTYLNASSSNVVYLSNISRSKVSEGTVQELKVVAVGKNGERSAPLLTSLNWRMETTDTTLPAEEPVNIMTEAEVTSYVDPTSTESPENILTGTLNNSSDKWYSSNRSDSVSVRFNHPRKVVRWVVEHAGAGGESVDNGMMNTKDFNLEYKDSKTGQWIIAVEKREVNEHVTDVVLDEPITAQEWRLNILTADNGSPWGGIRIYNWKMYESVNRESTNIPMNFVRAVHVKEDIFSVVLSNGIPGSSVSIYSNKEATDLLAEGTVNSNGVAVFHQLKLSNTSGLLYYRSCQPRMDLSHILAVPYEISDTNLVKVHLESKDKVILNQIKPLNLSEHFLTLHYSDQSSERISLNNVLVEVESYDDKLEGEQQLQVTFAGVISDCPLIIENEPISFDSKELKAIELVNKPKTNYLKGESLDLTDGLVSIQYTDGVSFEASLLNKELFNVSSFDKNELGVQTLLITHRSRTLSIDITVKEETVNFQRLDQLIGKVQSSMQQNEFDNHSEGSQEKAVQFLKEASILKTKQAVSQKEVDECVAEYSDLS